MPLKSILLFFGLTFSAYPLFAEEAAVVAAEPPSVETAAEVAAPELSPEEMNRMLGYLTAMGGGVATLQLQETEIEEMAGGLSRLLKGEVEIGSVDQAAVEKAFSEAQARAEAVANGASDLPQFSEGSLEKIGMLIALQSGILQLGFGPAEAAGIEAGFLAGAKATGMPEEMEAKMPAFEASINQRVQAAQSAMQAEQARLQREAMAEFKSIAEDWATKEPMHVVLETTQGDVEIELYPREAPLAVANFIGHVENGYYDGLTFHRVIDDFMIQGGDPLATGAGGESIWGKPFPDEFSDALRFDRVGMLAMANSGPMTNGSQFFITTSTPNWLNDKHTIFGKVVDGYDNVKAIEKTETDSQDKPVEPQEILRAYVRD